MYVIMLRYFIHDIKHEHLFQVSRKGEKSHGRRFRSNLTLKNSRSWLLYNVKCSLKFPRIAAENTTIRSEKYRYTRRTDTIETSKHRRKIHGEIHQVDIVDVNFYCKWQRETRDQKRKRNSHQRRQRVLEDAKEKGNAFRLPWMQTDNALASWTRVQRQGHRYKRP